MYLLYLLSRVKGHYKNAEPNNYVHLWKKVVNTISDPIEYSKNVDLTDIQIPQSRNLYNYIEKHGINNNNKILKYIILV